MTGGEEQRPATGAAAATTGASLIGGGAWQLASRLAPQVTTLVLSLAVARILGPEDFGRQSFIAFVVISATSFFSGGLKLAVMRYFAELLGREQPAGARSLIVWSSLIQVIAAVIGAAAIATTGFLGAEPRAAWLLAAAVAAFAILQTIPNALLLGAQRFRQVATIGLTTDLVALPATIAVLLAGGGIAGIFAVEAAIAAINLTWTVVVARRALRETAPELAARDFAWRPGLVRFALLSTASTVVTLVVWRRSEFFFLDAYSNDTQIGFYSIAFAALAALALVPESLASVIAPAFATLYGAGSGERIRTGFGRAIRMLGALTLPLTALSIALGPGAITLLYGEEFSDAGTILLVMLALVPALPMYGVSTSLLVGLGRARAPLAIGAAAALVNVGFDFLLIPSWDAVGAAVANGLGQLAVIVPTVAYATRLAGGMALDLGAIAAAAAVSALAGGLAWTVYWALGGLAGLALGALLGIGSIVAGARMLGVLSAADAAWLADVGGQRFGGRVGVLTAAIAREP